MTDKKPELLELIEAYAAAKSTGNATLVQSAGTALVNLLDTVSITENLDSISAEEPSDV
jgi:hypothetical protein